jgi:outer membrane protein OmpA-like peptidoglycan-associated protein
MLKREVLNKRPLGVALGLILLVGAALANAQVAPSTPSTEQMIEQLKSAPKTRSLRNLKVEVNTGSAGTAGAGNATVNPVRPSLSLLIQFDFNSAKVRPESQQALANLSQALLSNDLQASSFAVEGHTDAKGSADYNLKLSQMRAQAVREFLMARGVPDARLNASGKGASELANPSEPLAAENRRVRIVNLD